jgi:hypothetical protein
MEFAENEIFTFLKFLYKIQNINKENETILLKALENSVLSKVDALKRDFRKGLPRNLRRKELLNMQFHYL